jgi:hypothetical protein
MHTINSIIICFLIPFLIILQAVYFLKALQAALEDISPESRKMQPAKVWLLLVPLFNMVWIFFVVNAIGSSFKAEYEKHGVHMYTKPTYRLGLATGILPWGLVIFSNGPFISAVIVCWMVSWVVYWMQVSKNSNELMMLREKPQAGDEGKTVFA